MLLAVGWSEPDQRGLRQVSGWEIRCDVGLPFKNDSMSCRNSLGAGSHRTCSASQGFCWFLFCVFLLILLFFPSRPCPLAPHSPSLHVGMARSVRNAARERVFLGKGGKKDRIFTAVPQKCFGRLSCFRPRPPPASPNSPDPHPYGQEGLVELSREDWERRRVSGPILESASEEVGKSLYQPVTMLDRSSSSKTICAIPMKHLWSMRP